MPPADAGVHGAFGPTVAAVVVVCLLGVVLRWIFGAGRSRGRWSADRGTGSRGYGLLRAAATVPSRADAEALQALLTEAGIRSTTTEHPDGDIDVLVFREDLQRARGLIPGPHG
jgi:hypothetical protein